jgi:hypothetical protein
MSPGSSGVRAERERSGTAAGVLQAPRSCARCARPLAIGRRPEARYWSKRCPQASSRERLKDRRSSPPPVVLETCVWWGADAGRVEGAGAVLLQALPPGVLAASASSAAPQLRGPGPGRHVWRCGVSDSESEERKWLIQTTIPLVAPAVWWRGRGGASAAGVRHLPRRSAFVLRDGGAPAPPGRAVRALRRAAARHVDRGLPAGCRGDGCCARRVCAGVEGGVTGGLLGGDARGFHSALGIELPGWAQPEAPVSCFADPEAHARQDRDAPCSVNVESGLWNCHGCGGRRAV